MFPACRDLSLRPISLRSIFINLAKSRRRLDTTEAA